MEWIAKYWLEALFGGVIAVMGVCWKKLSSRAKKQDAVGLGVQALLRDRIIQAYNHYTEKGYCPIYGLENVEEMYNQYHALGGNGTITELVERVKELPTQPKGEKGI
ncbi:MAG: hypothetical protein ACLRWH_04500 [Emergencia sp.]